MFDEEDEEEEEERNDILEYQETVSKIPIKISWAVLREVADHRIAVMILRFLRKNPNDAFTTIEVTEAIGYNTDMRVREAARMLAQARLVINTSEILGKKKLYWTLNPRISQEDLDYVEKWYNKREERLERRHKAWLEGQRKRRDKQPQEELLTEEELAKESSEQKKEEEVL